MNDMDCDNCGARMRWETSHSRCDRCGHIRPCCEGAPVSASCVVPRADASPGSAGHAQASG
jgi:hypothetical protein